MIALVLFLASRFIPAWAGNTLDVRIRIRLVVVHPRVGGEHFPSLSTKHIATGSSPRGRGTPLEVIHDSVPVRFIPAWAGNTGNPERNDSYHSVHPRVGGEHRISPSSFDACIGSSPRGRGTHRPTLDELDDRRFIPAWAGNTPNQRTRMSNKPVHPRVGGEHYRAKRFQRRQPGSSPRGRGTQGGTDIETIEERFIPAWAGNTNFPEFHIHHPTVHPRVGGEHIWISISCSSDIGSSPRGRGTLRYPNRRRVPTRFIPAWAGNTDFFDVPKIERPVHPRVGGEHIWGTRGVVGTDGSSPRGRGTRYPVRAGVLLIRFIPAWAGNTALPRPSSTERASSSPRGRGTLFCDDARRTLLRFIPAWAGNTPVCFMSRIRRPVHPRVGGEHFLRIRVIPDGLGSSPRGRGTPQDQLGRAVTYRFIPAWAGNTIGHT